MLMRYSSCWATLCFLLVYAFTSLSEASTATTIYAANCRGVVEITTFDSGHSVLASGSGFVVEDGRLVVTCAHVIEGASSVEVSFAGVERRVRAKVAKTDFAADVAVLALDSAYPHMLRFADSKLTPGTDVFAIGSPLGLSSSIASGIISAMRRMQNGLTYIQTTVPSSAGSSGCPLFDKNGKVIGMMRLVLVGETAQNLNFAIPYTAIRPYVESTHIAMLRQKVANKEKLSVNEIVDLYANKIQSLDRSLSVLKAKDSARAVIRFSLRYRIDPRMVMAIAVSSSKSPRLDLASVEGVARGFQSSLFKANKGAAWNTLTWSDLSKGLSTYASHKLHLNKVNNIAFVKRTLSHYNEFCGTKMR